MDLALVETPPLAARLFASLQAEEQEVFCAAFLKANNALIGVREIFRGTLLEVVAQPREILREALKLNAAKFLVAHNHVSGEILPSDADVRFTMRLRWAAEAVGIELVDHLILAPDGQYFSFLESKLLAKACSRPWRKRSSRSRENPGRYG